MWLVHDNWQYRSRGDVKLKRKAEREEANLKRMKKQKTDESTSQAYSAKSAEDNTDSDIDIDCATVDEYIPESVKTTPKPERRCQKTTNSHYSLKLAIGPESQIDVLATLVLHDLGVVSPIDRSKVIDRSKIRQRKKTPEKLQQNDDQFDHTGIEGVFL